MLIARRIRRLPIGLRSLRVGDPIPDLKVVVVVSQDGKYHIQRDVNARQLFGPKVVLVGFPGAFTPTCTATHIPDYVKLHQDFKAKGYQLIALAVNDPFVLKEFGEELKTEITFIADGSAKFTKALDAGIDLSEHSLGYRSRRFSAVVQDGKLIEVNDERGSKLTDISKAETVLKTL
jgi:peroxiredoxin